MDSYQSSDQEEDAQGGSANEGQGVGNNTIKRTRRLAMNRVTARERRKRKRQQLEDLAIQAENLKVLNASIQQDNAELRARIRQLSAAVAALGDVSAPTTNNSMPMPMPMPTSLPASTGGTSAFITGTRAVPSHDLVQLLLEQQNRMRMGLSMPSDDFLQPPPSQTHTSVEPASSDMKNSNSYAHLISHAAHNPSVMLQLQQSAVQQRNGSASTFGNDSLFSSLLEQHQQTSRQDSEASTSGVYQQRQNIQSSLQPPPPSLNRGHAANRFSNMASSNNSNPSSSSNPSCNEMLIQQWIRERQSQNNQPK